MKNLYLLIFIVVFSFSCLSNSFCQEFGVQGASWHYTKVYHPIEYPVYGFVNITYERDSIISDETVKIFKVSENPELAQGTSVDTIYIFNKMNKVYYFWRNKQGLLYDFDINVGDTITYDLPYYAFNFVGDSTVSMKIDSISFLVIDNKEFRTIFQSPIDAKSNYQVHFSKINERIGNMEYLLPQPILNSAEVDEIRDVRCYTDFETFYQSPQYGNMPCDTMIFTSDEVNLIKSNSPLVYPNPCTDLLQIKNQYSNCTVEIFSVSGQKMLQKHLPYDSGEINTSKLQKGSYFLKLTHNNYQKAFLIFKD